MHAGSVRVGPGHAAPMHAGLARAGFVHKGLCTQHLSVGAMHAAPVDAGLYPQDPCMQCLCAQELCVQHPCKSDLVHTRSCSRRICARCCAGSEHTASLHAGCRAIRCILVISQLLESIRQMQRVSGAPQRGRGLRAPLRSHPSSPTQPHPSSDAPVHTEANPFFNCLQNPRECPGGRNAAGGRDADAPGAPQPCPVPAVASAPHPASLGDLLFLEHQKLQLADKTSAGPR